MSHGTTRARILFACLVLALTTSTVGLGKPAGNDDVKKAQQALHDKGLDPGPVDGVMGPKTRAAIREYQKSQDMPQTGRLDSTTAGKLGVPAETVGGKFKAAGGSVAAGSKGLGHEIKQGKPVAAGKEFGKGVGRAAKHVGGGVKKAVSPKSTPKDQKKPEDQKQ